MLGGAYHPFHASLLCHMDPCQLSVVPPGLVVILWRDIWELYCSCQALYNGDKLQHSIMLLCHTVVPVSNLTVW